MQLTRLLYKYKYIAWSWQLVGHSSEYNRRLTRLLALSLLHIGVTVLLAAERPRSHSVELQLYVFAAHRIVFNVRPLAVAVLFHTRNSSTALFTARLSSLASFTISWSPYSILWSSSSGQLVLSRGCSIWTRSSAGNQPFKLSTTACRNCWWWILAEFSDSCTCLKVLLSICFCTVSRDLPGLCRLHKAWRYATVVCTAACASDTEMSRLQVQG